MKFEEKKNRLKTVSVLDKPDNGVIGVRKPGLKLRIEKTNVVMHIWRQKF